MNTRAWLISFKAANGRQQQVAHLHNSIADYRASVDPNATVAVIDVAAVENLIQTILTSSFTASPANEARIHAAISCIRHGLPEHADGNVLKGNADLVPAKHASLGDPACP